MSNLLVVDVSNIAHIAFHSTRDLSYEDVPTGVLYGMYRKLETIAAEYMITDYAFCFDSSEYKRREILPGYKGERIKARAAEDEDMKQARKDMFRQIRDFYRLVLDGGCTNLFGAKGYEADDMIASVVKTMRDKVDRVYILSSDEDLYQLLAENVSMIKTKGLYTLKKFQSDYNIHPAQWASVKAWAGCSSDNVPGLVGIGEKRACQFLLGKFKKPEVFTDQIEVYNRNIGLTRLPFPGCPKTEVVLGQSLDWTPLKKYIHVNDGFPRGVK